MVLMLSNKDRKKTDRRRKKKSKEIVETEVGFWLMDTHNVIRSGMQNERAMSEGKVDEVFKIRCGF